MRTHDTIHTEADYDAVMEKLENLWDVKPGTPEADQLSVLGMLIDQYEAQQFPIAAPNVFLLRK